MYIGSIEANLNRLNSSCLFSAFDMSNGFMSLEVEPQSRQYFAFNTPSSGSYQFKRAPFGWVNSWYSRFMYRLVSIMPVGTCLSYVDDVLLHSKDGTGEKMVYLIDKFLAKV